MLPSPLVSARRSALQPSRPRTKPSKSVLFAWCGTRPRDFAAPDQGFNYLQVQILTQGNAAACRAFHACDVISLCLLLLEKGTDLSKSFAVKTLGNLCCDREARAAGAIANLILQYALL
jgi:hypothetical protein